MVANNENKNDSGKVNRGSSEKNSGRIVVNRPVVSVGKIKKSSAEERKNDSTQGSLKNERIEASNVTNTQKNGTNTDISKEDNQSLKENLREEVKETRFHANKRKTDDEFVAENEEKKKFTSLGAKLRDEKIGNFLKDNNGACAGRMLQCGNVDIPLLMIFIILIAYGLVMVFSASYAYASVKEDNSFAFVKKQIFYLAIGIVLAFLILGFYDMVLNRKLISKAVILYYLGALAMLVLIFVPGMGIKEGVTRRWLDLKVISLQPSEFAKGALILILAWYYNKYEKTIGSLRKKQGLFIQTLIPYCIAAVVVLLVFLEKHLSGTIILVLITIIMVFTGEKNHKFTVIVFTIGVLCVSLAIGYLMQFEGDELKANAPDYIKEFVQDYSWKRIEAWLEPERFEADDELWQSLQGLNAIGSGGFMGVGFGNSRQKHMFVSQPQNDFVFTILCEEMGFVGGMIVVILFAALVWRGYVIGKRIPDTFCRMSVWGLCTSIGMQAFLNMGVVTTLLPNTGISLPFFSYGGSSIISLMIEVGLILAMSRYARKEV